MPDPTEAPATKLEVEIPGMTVSAEFSNPELGEDPDISEKAGKLLEDLGRGLEKGDGSSFYIGKEPQPYLGGGKFSGLSRQHARISNNQGIITVEDLTSSYGTYRLREDGSLKRLEPGEGHIYNKNAGEVSIYLPISGVEEMPATLPDDADFLILKFKRS